MEKAWGQSAISPVFGEREIKIGWGSGQRAMIPRLSSQDAMHLADCTNQSNATFRQIELTIATEEESDKTNMAKHNLGHVSTGTHFSVA